MIYDIVQSNVQIQIGMYESSCVEHDAIIDSTTKDYNKWKREVMRKLRGALCRFLWIVVLSDILIVDDMQLTDGRMYDKVLDLSD